MITQKANLHSSLAGMDTKTQWLVWNICRGIKVLCYYLLLRTARPGSGHWMASTLECLARLAAMYRLFQSFCERGDHISFGGWLGWLAGLYAGACAMNYGEECFVFSSSFQGVFRFSFLTFVCDMLFFLVLGRGLIFVYLRIFYFVSYRRGCGTLTIPARTDMQGKELY